MTYISNKDFLVEVAKGKVPGHSIIHVFGENDSVGTTYVPVSDGGIYQTPQVAGATTLRVKAGGNANDTAAGTGAREVTFIGIDETGAEVTEAVATLGALASLATTATFIRLHEIYVSASGTYATAAAGSHAADITVENGAGGTDWGIIHTGSFPHSQTGIGARTIPVGYTGYLLSSFGFSDSSKTTELIFFQRTGILDAAAPYSAMRVLTKEYVQGGEFVLEIKAPILIGTGCDCGYMSKVSATTAKVEVDFEILLIDNNYL